MGCIYPKVLTSPKIYFDERKELEESINPLNHKDLKTHIKLEFSLENIETNYNYQIIVKFQEQSPFFTEAILGKFQRITFNKCFICDYYFEKKQLLDITLLKNGIQYGSLKVTLGNIVGSIRSIFKGSFNNQIRINIAAEEIIEDDTTNANLMCQLIANYASSEGNFYNPEDKISYRITSRGKPIYESESMSTTGNFEEVERSLR